MKVVIETRVRLHDRWVLSFFCSSEERGRGGAVKGGGARFKCPFPPSLGPEDCTLVTYQLVLRTVRFDASHLSANP